MPCGATHVSHDSICSGCGACERGREHVASTSAARRWLEPVNVSPTIALQLQESCCKHMGRPHAACTTCRPSALEGCYVRMRSRRLSAGTIQLQPLHDHVIRCITDCCDMPGIAMGQQVTGARKCRNTYKVPPTVSPMSTVPTVRGSVLIIPGLVAAHRLFYSKPPAERRHRGGGPGSCDGRDVSCPVSSPYRLVNTCLTVPATHAPRC